MQTNYDKALDYFAMTGGKCVCGKDKKGFIVLCSECWKEVERDAGQLNVVNQDETEIQKAVIRLYMKQLNSNHADSSFDIYGEE